MLENLLDSETISFPHSGTELAVHACLFNAIVNHQCYRKDIPSLARRLMDRLRANVDSNYKLLAASGLFVYIGHSGDFGLLSDVISCTQADFHSATTSALNRAWYATRLAYSLRYADRDSSVKARMWLDTARTIIRKNGLKHTEAQIAIFWAWSEECFGSDQDLRRELEIINQYQNPECSFEAAFRNIAQVFLSARQGNFHSAAQYAENAVELVLNSGYSLGRDCCLIGLAVSLIESKQLDKVPKILSETKEVLIAGPIQLYLGRILRARFAQLGENKEQTRIELCRALSIGAKHRLESALSEHLFHRTLTHLCTFALSEGIEIEYAKKIIRAQRLKPPQRELIEWPWPVRIHLLGDFSIEIDGIRLVFSGKTPKKALILLKALASSKNGQWEIDRLGALLWPDAEGDAVRNAFHVTHLRLRKLLGRDDVVVLREGQVSLNPDLVWTDVNAFERLAEPCLDRLRTDQNSEALEDTLNRTLSLYRGDLLKNDSDTPWLIAARDRIKSKWLRCLKAFGSHFERQQNWDQAQSIYERLLEHDNVADEIYRRLMRCQIQAGRNAEALRTYRRCRQMLSNVLGITPSPKTHALFLSISS